MLNISHHGCVGAGSERERERSRLCSLELLSIPSFLKSFTLSSYYVTSMVAASNNNYYQLMSNHVPGTVVNA